MKPLPGAASSCLGTSWFQSSNKIFPIVRQGKFCETSKSTVSKKYCVVPILRHGGFNSPNGKNLSGNVDHQINLLYYNVSVSFKHILVCLNQYLDAGKRNRQLHLNNQGIYNLQDKVGNLIFNYYSKYYTGFFKISFTCATSINKPPLTPFCYSLLMPGTREHDTLEKSY